MHRIQNLDLKNKLVLLAAVSGAMAVLMACTAFVWHDLQLLRFAQIDQLRTQAEMLAAHTSESDLNGFADASIPLLANWKDHASIDCICVFNEQGTPVAFHSSTIDTAENLEIPNNHYSYRYTEFGTLELFHPISKQGREIGVVYLKANMREFYAQRYSYATVAATVMLCSLAVAVLFASMMQSLISKPILDLAEAAREITTHNDYTIRVATNARDELGVLYESFNRMVEQIQSSRRELEQARDEMEHRVEQRTCELQEEVEERKRFQRELVLAKDAAEAASESKSRFVANMSHEIRTPLNGILGFTDYILTHDHRLSEVDRRDYLGTIRKSGEGLLVLVNDILDLSKVEAGQMEFERLRFSPHDVISEVISILRPKAIEKKLSLEYRWEGPVPDTIESDPLRFRQLLTNLVANAVKFTGVGSVEVVARLDSSNRKLGIDVIDTGIGIPLDTQRILFQPFTQGDSSVTRRFGGTGLGLSICKFIAMNLGGEVTLKSEVGRGSTFTLTIGSGSPEMGPPEYSNRDRKPVSDIIRARSGTPISTLLANRRILVADDGETNRKLIRLLLQAVGAEVILVEDGLQAVVAASEQEFDLILIDMQMPVMDGYSASAKLRADGFSRPIVALTAHAMRGDEARCLEAGCSDYLTKPIRQDVLLARLSTLISGNPSNSVDGSPENPSKEPRSMLISELPIEQAPFAELVCEFVKTARNKMCELRQARRDNNLERMAKLAHWMKGTGGMAGFPVLTEPARSLEDSIRAVDPASIEGNLLRLEELVGQLQSPELARS